ncbi:calcium-translocating P-type ATPase [Dacryopinax primogenitus]|uniref:Calcium-transporting ATPase n=1 Tax=Dacryopinax primogenitus (strain DJM 731) TaxID=1858805 RepID=M5GDU0_DACPD|nr:calcium-translocating P-type ATPase [Dacryopinax primogenitus]EJU04832.1 calcium-translocating P-type ATPase [Dacryopinax primogenitus]
MINWAKEGEGRSSPHPSSISTSTSTSASASTSTTSNNTNSSTTTTTRGHRPMVPSISINFSDPTDGRVEIEENSPTASTHSRRPSLSTIPEQSHYGVMLDAPQTPPQQRVMRRASNSPPDINPSNLSPTPQSGGLSPPFSDDLLRVPSSASTSSPTPHTPPSPGTSDGLRVPSPSFGYTASSGPPSPITPPGSPGALGGTPYQPPPSPALSTISRSSSVHFAPTTSVALRDNHPDATSGFTSLAMLNTPTKGAHHMRRPSTNTFASSSWEGSFEGAELGELLSSPRSLLSGSGRRTLGPSDQRSVIANSVMSGDTGTATEPGGTSEGDTKPGKKMKKHEREALDASKEIDNPAPFAFPPVKLASLVDPKNLELLHEFGGAEGLARGLGTDRERGLGRDQLVGAVVVPPLAVKGQKTVAKDKASEAVAERERERQHEEEEREQAHEHEDPAYTANLGKRQEIYGKNTLPQRKSKSLLLLMWLALKDKVLIILSIAAVVSLALGLYQDLGTPPERFQGAGCPPEGCVEPRVDWVEGVAIVIAILIVVLVGSLNDWQKERQFKKLNEKKEDRSVKVIRMGREMLINIKDVVVGDLALMEPGEILPVDGVVVRCHNLRCDESGATGESDAIRKYPFADCWGEHENLQPGQKKKRDCFMLSGSKVLEGVGEYIVIAVGPRSFHGRIMLSLSGDSENTPLQSKLNDLAELIAKLGSLAGALLFGALMIKFFVQLHTDPNRTANEKAMSFIQILIISVTIVVVAVPEGLPLAVTLALAFATRRMTKENLLVRVLGSCETMANANVVCTDKTGTLTTNVMSVVAGSIGIRAKFVRRLDENKDRAKVDQERRERHQDDFAVDLQELSRVVKRPLRKLLADSININSTAFEDTDHETGEMDFVGSKTETALLRFIKDLNWGDYRDAREWAETRTVQVIPFSSERKAMGIVVRLDNGQYRFYVKGASEILSKLCNRHVVVSKPLDEESGEEDDTTLKDEDVEVADFDMHTRENIQRTIIFYANQSLRTIAICYRDFESWPPPGFHARGDVEKDVSWRRLAQDMTLIAITGIEDPLREGVKAAVAQCHKAGVDVKMCTGDNVLTARSIASQCGIFTAGGIIMEGPRFRKLSEAEKDEIVPRLQVLARSSPEDKKILVTKLKALGQVVGVTGDGTNDGPALKTADVGFSMGITGTEVAKEASDIVLMDDNFTSIVKAIMWGRCVNDAVRKFLQFQVTVNITAVIVTFITAVVSGSETSALTAVQLLWINIIMDTFAALALATDPATPALLDRKPDRKTAPLFSVEMSKMIAGQAVYQTFIVLFFHFAGNGIFGYNSTDQSIQRAQQAELDTLVFNSFVFAQIFNSINCRRLDNKLNIFEGLLSNWYFIAITLLEIGVQILIVFVGGAAFQVQAMNGRDWGISIALGVMSIPIGVAIRFIPNAPVEKLMIRCRLMKDPTVLPVQSPESEETWNPAINKVRDNLNTFANIRGGRMRGSSFVLKSRSAQLDEAGVRLPSLLTMIPTLVATSVGAGWVPQSGSFSDPAGIDPSRSTAGLVDEGIQVHPDTSHDDFVWKRWGNTGT